MDPIYLSSITFTHGAGRLVSDLDEDGSDDAQLAEDLLQRYRATAESALRMACDVGIRSLAGTGVSPQYVVYATETSDGDPVLRANARLATALGCPSAVVMNVAGHRCGNLGLLLRMADGLLADGSAESVLLVTSDRVVTGPRMLPGALSVLSDGAAAVLATRRPAPGVPADLIVHGLASSYDARGGTADASPVAQLRTVQLGRSAVTRLRAATGRAPRDFTFTMLNNYRLSAQRFMAGAAGFSLDQLRPGPVAGYAHAFAADLLVNCRLMAESGRSRPGDKVALSATGPHSWTLIDAEIGPATTRTGPQ